MKTWKITSVCSLKQVLSLTLLTRLAFLLVICLSVPTLAADTYWQGGTGDWFEPGNWTNGLPTPDVYAYIDNGGTVVIADRLAENKRLYVNDGALELTAGVLWTDRSQYIGYNGNGTLRQSGGTNMIGSRGSGSLLVLGESPGYGIYELTNGSLWVNGDLRLYDGRFTQTGGTSTILGSLNLGYRTFSVGVYELSGNAQLFADEQQIGREDDTIFYKGSGHFKQTGGTNTVGYLNIFPATYISPINLTSYNYYDLVDGNLQILGGMNLAGILRFQDSSSTINAADNTLVNLAPGTIENASHATLTVGANSLTVYAAGSHPYFTFGTFTTQGMIHQAGQPLVINAGQGFGGRGYLDDRVDCAGTITASNNGGIDLKGGLRLFAGALVDLGSGTVYVEDALSSMSGGTLLADYLFVGYAGTGAFQQTAGTNRTERLFLGHDEGSSGVYQLSGGELYSEDQYVGRYGNGFFTQTGGTNTIEDNLELAMKRDSFGTYELSGGELRVGAHELIGDVGTGHFIQRGGIHLVEDNQFIGRRNNASVGTYELHAGELRVGNNQYIGGQAFFTQTGGINSVAQKLSISGRDSNKGTYTISAGYIDTAELYVRYGEFNITGRAADITVSQRLYFGPDSTFAAVQGSEIHMTGSAFENENTDPSALAGLSNLELIFEGGSEDIDPFEIAGEDMGRVLDGWSDNFALGTLTLGSADIGKIRLVDDLDNQTGWLGNEALYVYDLNIGAESYLDLNGYNLYYLDGSIDPAATIDYNGGHLIDVGALPGDVNGDGFVDALDLNTLIVYWGKSGFGRRYGDLNGNGVVDGPDYAEVLSYWGTGTLPEPTTTPEPATLGLLLIAALVLCKRRPRSI